MKRAAVALLLTIMQAHVQKMRALQQELEGQLKQVLTPEQFAKWQQMRPRRPQMPPNR